MVKSMALNISVFVCGAVVMVFELAGSRIMAPYFGGSIYVWTGIIGIILGSLSLGYWLGGKLADKDANVETYAWIIFLSAVAVFWALIMKDAIPAVFGNRAFPIELGTLAAALLLFAPASVLLGYVSPYAVRLKLTGMETSASTVGSLYAASTVGSIVGTFAAGYFLIPAIGTANIIFSLAFTLVVLSFFFSQKKLVLKAIVFVILAGCYLLLGAAQRTNDRIAGIVRIDTEYNTIKIFPGIDEGTGKEVLNLSFDPFATQSAVFVDSDELVWDYVKYYRLAKHFTPSMEKALMIGGGAYSYPRDFIEQYPGATLDVVEIDPGITAAAKEYFHLSDDPRLVVYSEDARTFLNRSAGKYDAIFDDAFGSSLTIPFQLTTKEAVERQYDILNDNGVVIANIGASIGGESGRFLRAEYATFRSVFPQVYLFPVTNTEDPMDIQNIMLVALKSVESPEFVSTDAELNAMLEHRWMSPIANDMPVLTDDHAPVEYYMKSII